MVEPTLEEDMIFLSNRSDHVLINHDSSPQTWPLVFQTGAKMTKLYTGMNIRDREYY